MSEPTLCLLQWSGVEPAGYCAPALVPLDQPDAFKHVEMLEHSRQRHGKRLGQCGDREFRRLTQAGQHGAPRRIGQSSKDSVEELRLIVYHLVKL